MSDLNVKLNWTGGMAFTGANSDGLQTILDGNKKTGASPVEILLEALGACSAIDVVVILDKQKTPIDKFEITLDADRHSPEPKYFTAVTMRFDLWGSEIKPEKLERAIALSVGKYCSVYNTLRLDMKLRPEYRIHAPGAAASGEYKVVDAILKED